MLTRLGYFIHRRRWQTVLVSALLFLVALVSLVRGGPLTSATISGLEAGEADRLVESVTGMPRATTLIVHFRSADLDPNGKGFQDEMQRALDPLEKDGRVLRVLAPRNAAPPIVARMVSPEAKAAFALVALRGDFKTARAAYESVRAKVRSDRLEIAFTGQVAYMHDLDETLARDLVRAELVSLPLALLILLLVFRSAVAALLPVAVGGLAVACGIAVVLALSHVIDLAQYTINICSLIGLGVAIDYSLFTVSRYREELARGLSFADALARTMDRAGRVVGFSGLAVATGLAGLFFFHGSFLFAMGVGGAIVVAFGVLFALTFLPALLAILGPRIDAGRLPLPATGLAAGAWHRWAVWVMRRPLLVLVPTLAVLLTLGAPFAHIRLAAADVRVLPAGVEAREAWDRLAVDFPSETAAHAEIIVTFPSTPALDETRIRALFDLSRRVAKIPGVTKVESIVDRERPPDDDDDEPEDPEAAKEDLVAMLLEPSELAAPLVEIGKQLTVGDRAVLMRATLEGAPESETARAAVREIRRERRVADGVLVVGGQTATDIDTTSFVLARAPRAVAFVVAVMFVVLLVLLESVLLPLKAILMNAVSIAGAFGALVFIFQDGHFLSGPGAPLEPALPVLLFCTLFGLSMDYEVLMLSRMKETWERTHDNQLAVAEGLEKTAGLVTSAAAIMVAVFGAFALARVVIVTAMGVGMAFAVALDATLVRVFLVPSTMRLVGALNWWAPRFLKRKRPPA
jgi:putative drug exporter of the RND superfamily